MGPWPELPVRDAAGNALVAVRAGELPEDTVFALVVVELGDAVLLVLDAWRRQWELPGGRIEPGETPSAAAARELAEETGVVGVELAPALVVACDLVAPVRAEHGAIYRTRLTAEPSLVVNEEVLAFRWWDPRTPPGPDVSPLDAEIARRVVAGVTVESMFDTFTLDRITVGDVTLRVRHGGSGPAVLLLHGHPRTHTTWHRVAPLLADRHTVVCPDLRGYGESTKVPTTADHTPYSKRAMAADLVALMRELGHERFAVAGHDRGSYVALRLALDHPDAVTALTVMDSVPIGEALARCDAKFARDWYHWFFFAQPEKPERAIGADPDAWYGVGTRNTPERMGEENFADFHRAIHDPATVRAMLEDYRAGLGVDRAHDDADRAAGRRVACPTQVLWGTKDDMEDLYGDVLAVWRPWTTDLRGAPIDSGHHMAEEAPEELAAALAEFLDTRG